MYACRHRACADCRVWPPGVKGAVILASGFGETGEEGAALEAQMMDIARAHGVRIIGPNTSGMFNLHHQINLLALDNVKPGDIGIVSQSGNMLLSLALEAQHNGQVGFSTYVGPGNQSDIGFNDYLRYLGKTSIPVWRRSTWKVSAMGSSF